MVVETLGTILGNVPTAAVVAVGAGFLRSFAGWLENTYKDGKVEDFELRQLGGTVIKYFALLSFLLLGLSVGEAVAGAFTLDVVTSAVKNGKDGTR